MSAIDDTATPDWIADSPASGSPSFELTFAYDDPDDPATVTVYPEETEARATTWISVDVDHAVDLGDAR